MTEYELKQGLNSRVEPLEASSPAPYSLTTVADLVERWQLKAQPNGKFSGAHPDGATATKDGFILCAEGNAFTNSGEIYTSRQVAELAGIDPANYEPCAAFKAGRAPIAPAQPRRAGGSGPKTKAAPFDWKRAQIFDYTDETGALLFQVARTGDGAAKQIKQRRPAEGGGWAYQLGDARRVLYRLPEVLAAHTVIVCEGEKAADAVNSALQEAELLGAVIATNSPHGAGKWRPEFGECLREKTVYVLPDNDAPGQKHAQTVAASVAPLADSVTVITLPGLPEKGDAADYLASGGTVEELLKIGESAPAWTATPEASATDETQAAPAKMFEILSYKRLRARPRLSWLIDQILPFGGVTGSASWLTAKSGDLKSFWAIDAGLCVATGTRFHGRDVKRGNVVYVAAEGAAGFPDRMEAWAAKHQIEVPDSPAFSIIERPLDVFNAATLLAFVDEVSALKPAFIVLDTQSRCSAGHDMNSTAEATAFFQAVSDIARELSAQVLVLAHNNRSGDYAGNHQGPAMVDTHLTMKRDGKNARLRCLKQKDGAPEEEAKQDFQTRVYDLGARDEKGREITSLALVLADLPDEPETDAEGAAETRAKVLEVLRRDFPNGATSGDWMQAVITAKHCQSSRFHTLKSELCKSGQVIQANRRFIAFDGEES